VGVCVCLCVCVYVASCVNGVNQVEPLESQSIFTIGDEQRNEF